MLQRKIQLAELKVLHKSVNASIVLFGASKKIPTQRELKDDAAYMLMLRLLIGFKGKSQLAGIESVACFETTLNFLLCASKENPN
jgi:hypothetical protein